MVVALGFGLRASQGSDFEKRLSAPQSIT